MLFEVRALPAEEYAAWMQDQIELAAQFQPIGTDLVTPLPTGDPASGEALFTELGCNSCHTPDGSQLVGPTVLGLGERAATRIDGYDAEQYLRESILLPCVQVIDGFTCVMPQNFGERLEAKDLADIIAYLLEQ
jgi:cytochrome c oxidase subunit 2